jgi:ATP-dependent helicase/nuclease subunit B
VIHVCQLASAEERLRAAVEFLGGISPATEVLIVGASRDAADDLARRLTLERGATFGLHRSSLTHLAFRFAAAEMARRAVAPASSLAEAIAARVSFEARQADALEYFTPVAGFPGFARALASTLTELRLAGVSAERLESVDGAGRDVAELLRRFERQLESGRVVDRAALFEIAAGATAEGTLDSLRRMPMVFLDVPVQQRAERDFVDALIARSPSVLVTVVQGDDSTSDAVHDIATRRGARTSAAGTTTNGAAASSDLHRARTYLFAAASPPAAASHGDVTLFSAPGEGREAVEIARRILEDSRAGTPFDRMAVLLRAPEIYGPLVQTALRRAGIPAYFARGTLRPDPSGRAFLALVDCALEKLSARKFAEYLSLGQVPALDPAGAPPSGIVVWAPPEDEALGAAAEIPDAARPETASTTGGPENTTADGGPLDSASPDTADSDDRPVVDGTLRAPWKWEQLLVESAVVGGRERWSRRLAGLEAEYRTRLEEMRESEPDSPRVAAIERDLANLRHLSRFALPVIERLAALPGRASWGAWIAALETLAPMVLRRPERVLSVLAGLRPLDVIGPVALDEVRDVLAADLTTLAERPPATRYGCVFVGTIEQSRGRSFDIVFLPGLAERIFPQKPREDPILLDEVRRALASPGSDPAPLEREAAAGPRDGGHRDSAPGPAPLRRENDVSPLATQTERSQRERLLLRLAVGAASRRLCVSYSRIELTEARPRVPSFYALELERAITGLVPDPQAMEREAAAAGDARLAWPAPEDPARAIDEVEHDLATLRVLLASGEATGRARYLLELNNGLARSLRTRWARWRSRWTERDGIVRVTDGTREALAAARLGARAYSPSALQKFAACPYQFFLSAICRLEPRPEIVSIVELDPATRGHLFHRVQADVMRALAEAGRLPLSRESRDAARETLEVTLDRVADEYRENLAPAVQRIWQDQVASMRADLRMWLERSIETQAEWEPIAFELAFGLRGDAQYDERSVESEVTVPPGFRLRGIVDLVERRRGAAELRVTDYKTGGNWTKRNLVVGGGETLQPVLYGLAIEDVLAARVVESRLFYCTRNGGFSERVVPMSESARARGVDVLAVIDRAIASGFLPPAPRPRACGICDFRDVCGPQEELRIQKKDGVRLDELRTLREWP